MPYEKVYRKGFVEFWIGMKLASDAELMFSYMGVEILDTAYPDLLDRQTLCSGGIDTISAALKVAFPSDWAFQGGYMLFGVWDSTGVPVPPYKFLNTSSPVVGTRGPGGSAPQNTAVLVHKTVPFGKGGRMYLPGVSEAAVSPNGALDGSELTIWQDAVSAAADDLQGYIGSNFIGHAIQSKLASDSTTSATKPVFDYAVDGVVATQRRRLRR